jgi:hypothetical protein
MTKYFRPELSAFGRLFQDNLLEIANIFSSSHEAGRLGRAEKKEVSEGGEMRKYSIFSGTCPI